MLFEVDPTDLHYMTDRQEQFDLKISKRHLSWMPLRSAKTYQK